VELPHCIQIDTNAIKEAPLGRSDQAGPNGPLPTRSGLSDDKRTTRGIGCSQFEREPSTNDEL